MKIKAIVEFDIPDYENEDGEMEEIDISPDEIVGESVSVKSGKHENLVWGAILSAELLDE